MPARPAETRLFQDGFPGLSGRHSRLLPIRVQASSVYLTTIRSSEAIKLSKILLRVLRGPLQIPDDLDSINPLTIDRRPVPGVTTLTTTARIPECPDIYAVVVEALSNQSLSQTGPEGVSSLPTLRPIPGSCKSKVIVSGPQLAGYIRTHLINHNGQELSHEKLTLHHHSSFESSPDLLGQLVYAWYDSFPSFNKRFMPATSLADGTGSRQAFSYQRLQELMPSIAGLHASTEGLAELDKLSKLWCIISEGSRGRGVGLATSDVQVGDSIWQSNDFQHMAVMRFVAGRYQIVGRALFFLPDGTSVTPRLRREWEAGEEQGYLSDKMDAELDILDLHTLACEN